MGDSFASLVQDLGSSPSLVAVWRLWAYLITDAIYTLENLWDAFKAMVIALVDAQQVMRLKWYQQQALLFQYGDPLEWINEQYTYSIIDESKRVVARASASEVAGGVRMKVAVLDNGQLAIMPTTQLSAFGSYMQKKKPAGVNVTCVSYDADNLRFYYTIFYDPLRLRADVKLAVEAAINNYRDALEFEGIINLTRLTDAIQKASGVIDPQLTGADARYGALPFSAINREYKTNAGYYVIDPAFPLTDTITYLPYV